MKVHGWCEVCHRIKRVQVSNMGMANMAQRGTPTGICDECEDEREKRRRGAAR